MYTKEIGEVLTFGECLQVIDQCILSGILQKDPNDENRILVLRGAKDSTRSQLYSQRPVEVGMELFRDVNGQKIMMQALAKKQVEMKFQEPENFIITTEGIMDKKEYYAKKEGAKNERE